MIMNIGKEWMPNLASNLTGTFAHEFYHSWNYATFYPSDLFPYNYNKENYTTFEWFVEGITNYYAYLSMTRLHLISDTVFFQIISSEITNFETSPGRGYISLSESDFPAWINAKQYINYRSGGAVVGFLLDLEIRQRTKNKKSLDDFMMALYLQTQKPEYKGYDETIIIQTLNQIGDYNMSDLYSSLINNRTSFDYKKFFSKFGIQVSVISEASNETYSVQKDTLVNQEQKEIINGILFGTKK
jgi:predicted metalloprotease with PDZ domain